mmetsp:Transcript_16679/g.18885  ORF Transcript_16679/g.18885 Transcript_16679/m.18885 type:complete len:106 (-) Transcript_16679:931-1248(-)
MPIIEWYTSFLRYFGASPSKSIFIYGGNWLARPVHPKGVVPCHLLGSSSNQEQYSVPLSLPISIDDWVTFRPTQSEAVINQFGPIAIFEKGKITEMWKPLHFQRI